MKRFIFGIFILGMFLAGLHPARAGNDYGPWELLAHGEAPTAKILGFHTPQSAISVACYSEGHYTIDGGKTWPDGSGLASCYFGLDILDTQTAWCSGRFCAAITHDGGKTWKTEGIANVGVMFPNRNQFVSFINPKYGWVGSLKKLSVTQNAGQSWTDLLLPQGLNEIAAIHLYSPEVGYLIDPVNQGHLYITKDGGKTWSSLPIGFKGDYIAGSGTPITALRFTDPQNGIIVTARHGGQLWTLRTSDGGKTWTNELIPGFFGMVYLSRDGKLLTVTTITNQEFYLLRLK